MFFSFYFQKKYFNLEIFRQIFVTKICTPKIALHKHFLVLKKLFIQINFVFLSKIIIYFITHLPVFCFSYVT